MIPGTQGEIEIPENIRVIICNSPLKQLFNKSFDVSVKQWIDYSFKADQSITHPIYKLPLLSIIREITQSNSQSIDQSINQPSNL